MAEKDEHYEEQGIVGSPELDQAAQLNQDLIAIVNERQDNEARMQLAESKILVSGSAEYIAAEQQKEHDKDPTTGIVELRYSPQSGGEVVVVGTEHPAHYDADHPEIQYLDSLVRAIPEGSNKILILEGQYGDAAEVPDNPAEAFTVAGGEFGYMAALAKQRGVEVVPAEPDPHDSAKKILAERPDITRGELALHYALKSMAGLFRESGSVSLQEVAPYLHHSVGIAGSTAEGGLASRSTSRAEVMQLDEAQRAEIETEMPRIIQELNAEFEKIVPGETLLELEADGHLSMRFDVNQQPVLWDPTPELSGHVPTKITEISRMDMLIRDRHTFELGQQALERGKEPIIAVGGSHVSTLRPAFDAAFN